VKTLLDDAGNVIPPPNADTDVGKLIYLLEYCRSRKFVLGPLVQIGEVVVQVKDSMLERDKNERTSEVMSDDMRQLLNEEGDA
jgi:hypothetical protein